MSPARKNPIKRKTSAKLEVGYDMQLHVSMLTVDSEHFVELRTWIPSVKEYGRGVVLPMEIAGQTAEAIQDIVQTEAS